MGKFRRRRNSDEYAGLLCILCSVLLGRMEEDSQHCDGKDDADGICNSGVVDGSALCRLTVEQTAQALRAAEAASTKTLVQLVHPDWDGDQVDEEVALITEAAAPPPVTIASPFAPDDAEPVPAGEPETTEE